jgi:hypothetical protein
MAWIALAGVSGSGPAGCEKDAPPLKPTRECEGCTVVADPCPRFVVARDCTSHYDCPSGTECLAIEPTSNLNRNLEAHGHTCSLENEGAAGATPSGGGGAGASDGGGGGGGDGGGGGTGGRAAGGSIADGGEAVGEPVVFGGVDSCAVPTATELDRYALVTGFNAVTFGLHPSNPEGEDLSFTYTAPEDTVIVTCAIFRCMPVLEGGEVTRLDIDGAKAPDFHKPTFVNFDQCVLNYQQYVGAAGEVVPKEMRPPESARSVDCAYAASTPAGPLQPCTVLNCPGSLYACGDETLSTVSWQRFATSCPITTRLLLGCWSMDSHRVTAATLLEELAPTDVANFCRYFADEGCSDGTRGRACSLPAPFTRPGVCWDTADRAELRCFPTCTNQDDCADFLGHEGTSTRCVWPEDPATREKATTLLGICR